MGERMSDSVIVTINYPSCLFFTCRKMWWKTIFECYLRVFHACLPISSHQLNFRFPAWQISCVASKSTWMYELSGVTLLWCDWALGYKVGFHLAWVFPLCMLGERMTLTAISPGTILLGAICCLPCPSLLRLTASSLWLPYSSPHYGRPAVYQPQMAPSSPPATDEIHIGGGLRPTVPSLATGRPILQSWEICAREWEDVDHPNLHLHQFCVANITFAEAVYLSM